MSSTQREDSKDSDLGLKVDLIKSSFLRKISSYLKSATPNFTSVKLLDYAMQWEELEASQNVFATIVMTHLKAQETKRSPKRRKEWKLALIKRLYERGYDRSAILVYSRFWIGL